jgi:hypothetical protein
MAWMFFDGYGASQWNAFSGAAILVSAEDNFTNSAGGTAISFFNALKGTVNQAEVAVLDGNGDFGVGPFPTYNTGIPGQGTIGLLDAATPPNSALTGGTVLSSVSGNPYVYRSGGSQNEPIVSLVTAPSTATSPCVVGQMAADISYIYACVATNTWRRAAVSSW